MSTRIFNKFPSENRTFSIDWTNRLANVNDGSADTIATSSWEVASGINNVADNVSGNIAIIRVSGGTGGTTYTLENTITLTTSGYTLVDFIRVTVKPEPV